MNIINSPSPNFEPRENGSTPQFIILHFTEMTFDGALRRLCDPDAKVSAHYLIHKNGEIYNLVDDIYAAWHAGVSCWKGLERLNHHSIGIEIDNLGNEPFSEQQMQSCILLCKNLMQKYSIPRENVLGHSDIAPDRKVDPGKFFDWKMLDENEIGIPLIHEIGHLSIKEKQEYLKDMGYKIDVTGVNDPQTEFVIKAFEDHFKRLG